MIFDLCKVFKGKAELQIYFYCIVLLSAFFQFFDDAKNLREKVVRKNHSSKSMPSAADKKGDASSKCRAECRD